MDYRVTVQTGDKTIKTTVTSKSDTITAWIRGADNFFSHKSPVVFGLDVEWKPVLFPARNENPIATLQICAGNRCLIVQLIYLDHIPTALRQFLANPGYIFAGVEILSDAEKLQRQYELFCANLYDLRDVALGKFPWRLSPFPGLKNLAAVVAGIHLEKPKRVARSEWDVEELRPEQVEYACLDAYASCRVGVVLFFGYRWACTCT